MNYTEARAFISAAYVFGEKIDLENITRLMDRMGNPQNGIKIVHVAGTNGKGSTSTMLSYILQEAGYKTGLFISPYLEQFEERIQVDNVPVSKDDLVIAVTEVKEAIDGIVADGFPYPSEFEVVTAAGFSHFRRAAVDVIVLEVGMGGRFDATNVINKSDVSVITTIALDHMQYLGDTVEQIAFEKAGIIKDGGDVSVYPLLAGGVIDVIKEQAALRNATVRQNDPGSITLVSASPIGQTLRYSNEDSPLGAFEFDLALLGKHQSMNALNVLTACEILKIKGFNVDSDIIKRALAKVKFTGRFEVMNFDPYIIIDGGHNIEGVTSFVENLRTYFPGKKVTLFYGMLSDKQVDESVELLATVSTKAYTLTPSDARAVPAKDMAELFTSKFPEIPVLPLESIDEIGQYIDFDDTDAIYAFTGSLYMIGAARTELTRLISLNNK
ncbi:MAG: bifunctional folylpolyglutamate synthase/dihydrofolate synthase [Eubacteriaceae bacterium]|nr:bifunctional folylpolyglutamate synthase/dihydrofolate synthase [Eubacteriaceae bacterium]